MKKIAAFFAAALLLLVILSACQQFGKIPDNAVDSRIAKSINYHVEEQRFITVSYTHLTLPTKA